MTSVFGANLSFVGDLSFGGVGNWKYLSGWWCPKSYKEPNKLAPKAFNSDHTYNLQSLLKTKRLGPSKGFLRGSWSCVQESWYKNSDFLGWRLVQHQTQPYPFDANYILISWLLAKVRMQLRHFSPLAAPSGRSRTGALIFFRPSHLFASTTQFST